MSCLVSTNEFFLQFRCTPGTCTTRPMTGTHFEGLDESSLLVVLHGRSGVVGASQVKLTPYI